MKNKLLTALFIFILLLPVISLSASGTSTGRVEIENESNWTGSWSTSIYSNGKLNNMPFANSTLRQVVRVSIPGKKVRLKKFSNLFGKTPLVMQKVHLAHSTGEHSIDVATDISITFDGNESITIPPGKTVTSDALKYNLPALTNMAITIYFGNVPTKVSGHVGSRTNSYYQTGDAVAAACLTSPLSKVHWYVIDRIDVYTKSSAHAVVAYGDSITDGYGTTVGAQNRWTDVLATRLQSHSKTNVVGMLNAGIGATVVNGSGTRRLQRDVLNQTNVRYLIVLYGVNDILFGRQSASQVISAYKTIIENAHTKGVLVYGATILPFGGYGRYSEEKEVVRQQVNRWVIDTRAEDGGFDAAIDLSSAIMDPINNIKMLDSLSIDGLHPNSAGYQIMAEAIDLKLFISK